MRSSRLLIAGLLGLAATAVVAQPTGMPARRAGNWQVTMSGMGGEGRSMTMTQCVDPATERSFAPWHRGAYGPGGHGGGQSHCSKEDVHAIPGGWAFESVCERPGGGEEASSGRITGDFHTHYHMEVSMHGQGPERHMTMDAAWVGPCAPGGGQTITLPDGRTITIPQH